MENEERVDYNDEWNNECVLHMFWMINGSYGKWENKWNQMSQMNEWMSCGVEMKQKRVSITNIDSYGNQ